MFGTDESPHDRLERERREAFALLAALVSENYAVGRRSYGASLKPELRRRTFAGFDEERLHFASFRRFLEAAQSAGVIDVHPAPKGPDLEATPLGQPPVLTSPERPERPRRVRRDLWEAFINWDEGWARVYDKDGEEAFRFPKDPVPLEPTESTRLRAAVGAHPDRFVPIEPISFHRQLEWMREFVPTVSDPVVKSGLELALTSEKPVRAFSRVLEARSDVLTRWKAHRLLKVGTEIQRWAAAAGINVEIHESQPAKEEIARSEPSVAQAVEVSHRDRAGELRELLHAAIDRMPEAELLQIRLPVGYIVQR